MSLQVEYGLGFKEQRRPKVAQWIKPPLGCLKLNTDGCFRGSLVAGGGFLRNTSGDAIFAFHEFYDESCSNILEAELRALLTGLELCLENGYLLKFNIWAELDSKVGIQYVEGHTDKSLCVEFLHILDEIKFVSSISSRSYPHLSRKK